MRRSATDETTFRILDTLSRNLGNPISINRLTAKIRESYGTAHYPNIYHKLGALSEDGTIRLTTVGKSSIASLSFSNYTLLDSLAEIELRRKSEFLRKTKALGRFVMELEASFRRTNSIKSACLINPERNARLNRAELLILASKAEDSTQKQISSIHDMITEFQIRDDIRSDALLVSTENFADLLTSDEINPLREMLSDKIAFHNPQSFWAEIADILAKGRVIRLLAEKTTPARITEKDLVFNLSRFGYRELGLRTEEGEKICFEYILASVLMKGNARRINAIPALLSKNAPNYDLLIFLSQKYQLSDRLMRILKAMQKREPQEELAGIINFMQQLGSAKSKAV
jgi:hypothetical protein